MGNPKTCPMTGCTFYAEEDTDGMTFTHPLTDETLKVPYSLELGGFVFPETLFTHVRTVTMTQTSEILDVSLQRVSTIAKNETIPPHTVNGSTVFLYDDVIAYRDNRKPGRPCNAD